MGCGEGVGVVDVNNKTVYLGVSTYCYYEQVACEVKKEYIINMSRIM